MRLHYFYLLLFLIPHSLIAQEASKDLFAQAIKAQQSKNYTKAIDYYNQLLSEEQFSEELFLNAARAAHDNQDYVTAIVFVEKGLRIYPSSIDLKHNRSVINDFLDSDIQAIDEFFLVKSWARIYQIFSSGVWAFFSILLLTLFLVLLSICLFNWYDLEEKLAIRSMIICGILIVITMAATSSRYEFETVKDIAILIKDTNLKSGPEDRSETRISLKAGEKLIIQDQIGDWYKVSLRNSQIGWVELKSLELI